MLDDFFVRALIVSIMIALLSGPLGSLMIWRRMANFGDTLAHSALPAISLAFIFHIDVFYAVLSIIFFVCLLLFLLRFRAKLPFDALLVILSHSFLAAGLIIHNQFSVSRIDLFALLMGDILSTSQQDVVIIAVFLILGFAILGFIWKAMLRTIISWELASVYLVNPLIYEVLFLILLSIFIAISIKTVGVLLISATLIIPAATSRYLSFSPFMMMLVASGFSVIGCVVGLYGALWFDLPAGPSIVMILAIMFAIVNVAFICVKVMRLCFHGVK